MSPSNLNSMVKRLKQSSTIITPRLDKWLQDNNELVLTEEHADMLKKLVMAKPRIRSGSFSGSSRGQCLRAQVFGFLGVQQHGRHQIDAALQNLFLDGTWRHLRWQMTLLEADILDDVEITVINSGIRLIGSLDGAGQNPASGDKFGFELKGISNFTSVRHQPLSHHVLQVHSYMRLTGLSVFSVIYEHKATQEWREHIVTQDPAVMQIVNDELDALNSAVDKKRLPPILKECENGASKTFRDCPYRNTCLSAGSYRRVEAEEAQRSGTANPNGPRRKRVARPQRRA